MPQSVNGEQRALLAAVSKELVGLEAACADAERIFMNGNLDKLDDSIMDQRRLTHALQNAMDSAQPARTPEFDEQVRSRLSFIGLARDRHIALMKRHQNEVTERLNTLTRWKRAARKWLNGYTTPRGTGLDQMR